VSINETSSAYVVSVCSTAFAAGGNQKGLRQTSDVQVLALREIPRRTHVHRRTYWPPGDRHVLAAQRLAPMQARMTDGNGPGRRGLMPQDVRPWLLRGTGGIVHIMVQHGAGRRPEHAGGYGMPRGRLRV
jgi:hypothetical protein